MKQVLLIVVALVLAGASSCEADSDRIQRVQTERMSKQAHAQTGMPGITNFTERKFAKIIYELRDKKISTYSYFMDVNGGLHFLCESIGYGLPYSVQYVSPEKKMYNYALTLPQSEPNGLFMPDSLSATWVLCANGDGEVEPVYSEPPLIVTPFPLEHGGDLRQR